MNNKEKKVFLLTEIVSPYRVPVFNHIAKENQFDFKVLFLSGISGGRKWQMHEEDMDFDYEIIRGFKLSLPLRFPIFFNPSLWKLLTQGNPDVVICGGYQHPSYLVAFLYCKLFKKKFILWCESHEKSVRVKWPLAQFYRKYISKKASRCIVPGKSSFQYMKSFGIPEEKIKTARNAVDNELFSNKVIEVRKTKEEIKQNRGYPKRILVSVGRLLHYKGFMTLIEAYEKLKDKESIGLVLVGDGPDEEEFKQYCKKNNLKNVFFEGFKQQEELPFYYGISDVFIMPSFRDEWGLVLNEAMACGLPVIVSEDIGSAPDLVLEGQNGYLFKPGDVSQLLAKIKLLINDRDLCSKMGEKSLEIIAQNSPEICAEGFLETIESLNIEEFTLSSKE